MYGYVSAHSELAEKQNWCQPRRNLGLDPIDMHQKGQQGQAPKCGVRLSAKNELAHVEGVAAQADARLCANASTSTGEILSLVYFKARIGKLSETVAKGTHHRRPRQQTPEQARWWT